MNDWIFLINCGLALSAAIIALNVWNYRLERNGEWHAVFPDKMRRMTPMGWEYRPMTADECAEEFDSRVY